MKIQSLLFATGISLLLSGCGNIPVTPDELRQKAKNNKSFIKTETFTVNRPYKKVVATVKSRTYKCLDKSVETKINGKSDHFTHYKGTFVSGRKMSELHLQLIDENSVIIANNKANIGKDGWYILVTDIRPVDKKNTRLDIYRAPRMGIGVVVSAIHNWAKGSNKGCPDLTKMR